MDMQNDINNNFWYFNKDDKNDILDFLYDLHETFPEYVSEIRRLYDIILLMKARYITAVFECNYVDRQYRDTYYAYFSQKFKTYERNCLRISFFDSDNMRSPDGQCIDSQLTIRNFSDFGFEIDERLIGTVVLRPLIAGNIGNVLLDTNKLKVDGFVRTGTYHVMILGRKMSIQAFPYISQDSESMTCAETVIYNLLRYYGERYAEYRSWAPSEILEHIEKETSERALPSKGIAAVRIAKLLSDAHMYPRIYRYKKDNEFEQILYSYIEAGIPFIICVPDHAVSCIGHGPVSEPTVSETKQLSHYCSITGSFDLSTVKLNKTIIVMNDNKAPYDRVTLNSLVSEYAEKALPDHKDDDLEKIKEDHLHIIVPVYKRIFMDAAQANSIIKSWFLENNDFLNAIRSAYCDRSWGRSRQNPFVWRLYLTASRSYRCFKTKETGNSILRAHYMQCELPRFIWVCEIGTIELQKEKLSRVEIVLDATSSKYSENIGILSIGFLDHFIYVDDGVVCCIEDENDPDDNKEELDEADKCDEPKDYDDKEDNSPVEDIIDNFETDVKEEYLHHLFDVLYNIKCKHFEREYCIFRDINRKGV